MTQFLGFGLVFINFGSQIIVNISRSQILRSVKLGFTLSMELKFLFSRGKWSFVFGGTCIFIKRKLFSVQRKFKGGLGIFLSFTANRYKVVGFVFIKSTVRYLFLMQRVVSGFGLARDSRDLGRFAFVRLGCVGFVFVWCHAPGFNKILRVRFKPSWFWFRTVHPKVYNYWKTIIISLELGQACITFKQFVISKNLLESTYYSRIAIQFLVSKIYEIVIDFFQFFILNLQQNLIKIRPIYSKYILL